jgi:uncharacterized protein (DUF1778 family)
MTKRSHNVRIDEDLWDAAKAAAAAEGRTITDVIVAALRRLVAGAPTSAVDGEDFADLARRRLAIERLSERLDAMEAAQDQTETDLGGKVAVEPYPIERW